jgi:hypothetical protein
VSQRGVGVDKNDFLEYVSKTIRISLSDGKKFICKIEELKDYSFTFKTLNTNIKGTYSYKSVIGITEYVKEPDEEQSENDDG